MMESTLVLAIAGILSGLSALITVLLSGRKRKAEAEVEEADAQLKITEAADRVIAMAMRQLERMEADLAELTERVKQYREELSAALLESKSLYKQVEVLQSRVAQLEKAILQAGNTIPEAPSKH